MENIMNDEIPQVFSSSMVKLALDIHELENFQKNMDLEKLHLALKTHGKVGIEWRSIWNWYMKPWKIRNLLDTFPITTEEKNTLFHIFTREGLEIQDILYDIDRSLKKKKYKVYTLEDVIFANMERSVHQYHENRWSSDNLWQYDPKKVSTFRKKNEKVQWFPELYAFRTTHIRMFGLKKIYHWSCCGAKTKHHPTIHTECHMKMKHRPKLRRSASFLNEEENKDVNKEDNKAEDVNKLLENLYN